MNRNKILKKVLAKLALTQNTYTKNDIANLAKEIKKATPNKMKDIWYNFQLKHQVTSDKYDEILIDKLKGVYQVDLKESYKKALNDIISGIKKRKIWV